MRAADSTTPHLHELLTRIFLPSFLQDKVGCEALEGEETVGSVQAWAANMEKTKQRLQNEVEELTVELRRPETNQECTQPDHQDLRSGPRGSGTPSVNSSWLWSSLLFPKVSLKCQAIGMAMRSKAKTSHIKRKPR